MLRAEKVPAFDGQGASFQDYEHRVRWLIRLAKLEPSGRASAAVSRVNSVARPASLSGGDDHLDNNNGVTIRIITTTTIWIITMLGILRNYCPPEAAESSYQEVVLSSQYLRTGRTID